jgi:hypothetical protein
MIKRKYTVEDARREVKECVAEGYGFDYIRIFLNDLVRGKDITREECGEIMRELISGNWGEVECSFGTIYE